MKIALIATPYPLDEAPSPPLGLCYAAAACEAAGAEVRILDYIVSRYTPQKLGAALEAFAPDAVGINAVTMNVKQALAIIRDAKRVRPRAVTLMGGPHVSFDIQNVLRTCPQLDLIVIGEGEATLGELVPLLMQPRKWGDVGGIAFRHGNQVRVTPQRPLIQNLDDLPLPARHLLPMARYLALGFPVSVITSRGCPNQCIFCLGRRMVGHKPRFRSPRRVVDEIEQLVAGGHGLINIADDLFTASKSRVLALCEEIRRRRVQFLWSAFARVNTVDPEMLAAMRQAGCHSISFGIESGNGAMLKRVRKGITLNQARRAVAWSKAAGLRTHASFMVGLPGETPETMAETRAFARSLGIEHGYHFLSPFPGTTLKENIADYDLEILTDDWDLYDANQAIVRTAGLGPRAMDRFVAAAYAEDQAEQKAAEARYRAGTCSAEEFMQYEGMHRTALVHRLLSEDIIDDSGVFSANGTDPATPLIRHVARITGTDRPLVERTLRHFIQLRYLRSGTDGDGVRWSWADQA